MGGIRYNVHPLFFVVGLYYAVSGRIFIFLVYSFTALIHETGHAIAAEKAGYKLNKITLTPFGAIAKGNIEGLWKKHRPCPHGFVFFASSFRSCFWQVLL